MNFLSALIAGALIVICHTGCEKACTQLNVCRIQGYYNSSPAIIGYYARDVDTQIILHYKPNGKFDQLIDSSGFINTSVTGGYIYNESDTQELVLSYTGGAFRSQQVNDLRLVLPGVRTYDFTEVMVDGDFAKDDEFACSRGSSGCSRRVTSLKINGVYHDLSDGNTPLILYK